MCLVEGMIDRAFGASEREDCPGWFNTGRISGGFVWWLVVMKSGEGNEPKFVQN